MQYISTQALVDAVYKHTGVDIETSRAHTQHYGDNDSTGADAQVALTLTRCTDTSMLTQHTDTDVGTRTLKWNYICAISEQKRKWRTAEYGHKHAMFI